MGRCCRELLWEVGAMQWGDAGGEVLGGNTVGRSSTGLCGVILGGLMGGVLAGCSGDAEGTLWGRLQRDAVGCLGAAAVSQGALWGAVGTHWGCSGNARG